MIPAPIKKRVTSFSRRTAPLLSLTMYQIWLTPLSVVRVRLVSCRKLREEKRLYSRPKKKATEASRKRRKSEKR